MKNTGIIFQRDFRELKRRNAFLIISIVFCVITIANTVSVSIALSRQEWIGEKVAHCLQNWNQILKDLKDISTLAGEAGFEL